MMNARDIRMVGVGCLGAVGLQNGKTLAHTGSLGALQYRKAVVDHQCLIVSVRNSVCQVSPEILVLFGLAELVTGYDGVHVLIQTGSAEFQGQRVWVTVGHNDGTEPGFTQSSQKSPDMRPVADAVAHLLFQVVDIDSEPLAPVISTVPVQGAPFGHDHGNELVFCSLWVQVEMFSITLRQMLKPEVRVKMQIQQCSVHIQKHGIEC